MIISSNHPAWNEQTANNFASYLRDELIILETFFAESFDSRCIEKKYIVCLIPLFGEEELSDLWLNFFKWLGEQDCFIGLDIFIYLYGLDDDISFDSYWLHQIKFYTKYLSAQYHIFPLKISKFSKIDISVLFTFFQRKNSPYKTNTPHLNLIEKIIFQTKDNPLVNTSSELNLTSESNKFNSILNNIELDGKTRFLKNIIENCSSTSLIINKANLFNSDVLIESSNYFIKRFHLCSNSLTSIPDFSKLINLKVLNLSANFLDSLILDYQLPLDIEIVNLSKNRISSFLIASTYRHLKKLVLFNNPLIDFNVDCKKIPRITYLNIGKTKFEILPNVIFDYENLEFLCLSYLSLRKFDERIFQLHNLRCLDIRGMNCDEDIGHILKTLSLHGVKIIC